MALLLAQARNIPQAHAALVAGRWERSKWEGRRAARQDARHRRPRPRRALVAQRALAFGMRLIAYDPYVVARARPPPGRRARQPRRARRRGRLPDHPPPEERRDDRACRRRAVGQGQAGNPHREHRPGRHRRRGGAGRGDARRHRGRAPVSTSSPRSRRPNRPLFELATVVVTPHLGASTAEAQDKAGAPSPSRSCWRWPGDFVPFAVNVAARDVSEPVRPSWASPSSSAVSSPACTTGCPTCSRSSTRASSPANAPGS